MTVNMLRHSEPKGEESLTITSDKNTFTKECRLHLDPTKTTQNFIFIKHNIVFYTLKKHVKILTVKDNL